MQLCQPNSTWTFFQTSIRFWCASPPSSHDGPGLLFGVQHSPTATQLGMVNLQQLSMYISSMPSFTPQSCYQQNRQDSDTLLNASVLIRPILFFNQLASRLDVCVFLRYCGGLCSFVPRHNSTTPSELQAMVAETGFNSLDDLIKATVPGSIV